MYEDGLTAHTRFSKNSSFIDAICQTAQDLVNQRVDTPRRNSYLEVLTTDLKPLSRATESHKLGRGRCAVARAALRNDGRRMEITPRDSQMLAEVSRSIESWRRRRRQIDGSRNKP
jgi:hypothetical protein